VRGPHRRRFRRLQIRLLLWFLAAIVLAIGASVLTTILTSEEPDDTPTRVVSRHVQRRVAQTWDDPVATEAYVAELRETTGLDIRVRRDPSIFGTHRPRGNQGMVFEDGVAYVPVQRGGHIVGALALRTGTQAPKAWRVALALLAALLVLGLVARRVSMRLARPLEHVAVVAEKFGAGDLSARTGIEKVPSRWVAEEVKEVGRAFDGMADRIERVVTDQRELLAAISHELRSPLGRARVALEIARDRGGEPTERPLSDLERQLVEMDAILGDLLASARAGLADVRREKTDLGAWLRARADGEGSGPISVKVAPEATGREVDIDPALLGRALHNVFANAWAHGHPKDVPLEVRLDLAAAADDQRKKEARIVVRDHGPGFSADLLPRAFEPFVTGGDGARSPGAHGIGLGLSLVRRIVEAHGGSALARNVEENGRVAGAEIVLALPVS
jgi:two-component system OmpR family sensor kinase